MNKIDRAILKMLQVEFPLDARPFKVIGKRAGINERETIARVKRLLESGEIRQIRPILDSKKLGMKGTLVAMSVPENRIDEVADIINSYDGVSHNYLREHHYNIWFTLAAENEKRLNELIREIKKRTGAKDVLNLPTKKLFKLEVKFNI